MPSGRTNNSVESGRGLGHVTPTILAVRSAILASSDSLASCYLLFLTLEIFTTKGIKQKARQTSYLCQRISILVQRFNAVLLHDSFPATDCTDCDDRTQFCIYFSIFKIPLDCIYRGLKIL